MDLVDTASDDPVQPAAETAETANQEIATALEAGQAEEAARLMEAALARWPQSSRLQLTKGEVLHKQAGGATAALYYTTLLDERPSHAWAVGRLRQLLPDCRLSEVEAIAIAQAILASKASDAERPGLFDALLKSLGAEAHLTFLRAVAPGSRLFRLEWKLAVAETEGANVEAAIDMLEKARAEGRSNDMAVSLLSDLLGVVSRDDEAIDLLKQAVERDPDRPDPYRRLVNFLQRTNDFKQAGEVIESAFERWPNDWMLLFRLNRLPVEPERLKSIFHKISPTADATAMRDERFRFLFSLACLHVGEVERAVALLSEPFTAPVDAMANPVIKALGARSVEFWKGATRLKDNRTQDVQVTRAEGARLTVIVPTGIAFGYLPPAMLDALFAEHNVNAIYLRDFRKRAYRTGVISLGRDEAETIRTLKRLAASLGPERLVTMGGSMGGFAALRYGALLEAYAALSFAGPTELFSTYQTTKPTIWNPNFFTRLMMERESELPNDLVPLLRSSEKTRFFQFFGEGLAADERQARRLEGLPNVSVMPVRGVNDHIVADHMIGDGSFDAMLRLMVG